MIARRCSHRFIGSNICALCGWALPKPFDAVRRVAGRTHVRSDGVWNELEPTAEPTLSQHVAHVLEQAALTDPLIRLKPATVITPCPACDALSERAATDRILKCEACGQQWACERYRTAGEVIEFIRLLLAEDCDASRRRFYNAAYVLRAIAEAVDALPTSEERS